MRSPLKELGAAVLGAVLGGCLAVWYVFSQFQDEGLMAVYTLVPLAALLGGALASIWVRNRWRGEP